VFYRCLVSKDFESMNVLNSIKRLFGMQTESAEERAKREAELRKNVKMTEHREELNDLVARLGTDLDTVCV